MRIPSGVVNKYLYFVAVDATDLKTRETGLSSFTVYRSRNGGAAAAFTTPTINETSLANMPGVYELLLDEDMTIDSGDDTQEVCVHITHAGMAPVTRTFELYRPKITVGETITVSSSAVSAVTTVSTVSGNVGGNVTGSVGSVVGAVGSVTGSVGSVVGAVGSVTGNVGGNVTGSVGSVASGGITAASIAADAITAAKIAADVTTEIQSGLATAAALATVDGIIDNIYTGWELDGSVYRLTTNALEQGPGGGSAPTAAQVADAVWDEARSGHVTAGTFGLYLDAQISGVGGAVGPGAISYSNTVESPLGTPIDGASVWISTDIGGSNTIAGVVYTNASGEFEFMLDAGAYYLWVQAAGHDFTNPTLITVS